MASKLPKVQRNLLSRLRKKHSYEEPFVTNDEQIKLELRQLEELGHIECQWSQDWTKPVVFAWVPCELCIKGLCLGSEPEGEFIPFWHCEDCCRYDSDVDAAQAVREFAEIFHLHEDSEHNFGFEIRRFEAVKTNLSHHWSGRVRRPRAA